MIPCFRLTLYETKFPASLGTDIYRWSQRPLADAGAWSEGRIESLSDVTRSAMDQDGNFELAQLTAELSDDDHDIREKLETAGTEYFYGREGVLELLSESGRANELDWRIVHRGVLTKIQTPARHKARIVLTDIIGSKFSGFDLDRTIGVPIGDEHSLLPDNVRGLNYPIVVGEHSDQGRVDAAGNRAEKGRLSLIDTGDYDPSAYVPGEQPTPEPPQRAGPPTITSASVVGGSGPNTYTYAPILVTPNGWSALGDPVTVSGAPSTADMSIAWYVDLRISFDPGDPSNPNKVVIAGRSTNPPTTFLDEVDYIDQAAGLAIYFDGAKADAAGDATRDELDREKSLPPLSTGPVINDAGVWGRFLVGEGAIDTHQLYWSDLADGTQPKRVLADPDLDGVEFLTPDSAGWPHSTPYLDLTNPITGETIRGTYVYVRGLRAEAHRNGSVTMAVNGCGMEEVGDGSGLMVDEAFKAGQLFVNEHLLKNNGTGYRSGTYGPLETFTNGDAQLQTSAWEAAQAITVDRIGGRGYMAAWVIRADDKMTIREWARRFCLSFDCRLMINQHGQLIPIVVDDLADPDVGRPYREFVDEAELVDQNLADEEIENRIIFDYDFDPDANAFTITGVQIQDETSIAAHVPGGVVGDPNPRGVHQRDTQQLYCVRDPATAFDSRARRLTRNRKAPRYVTFATPDLRGLEDELSSQVRFTHRDGKGANGDNLTPLCVLKHTLRASFGQNAGVEMVGMDIERIAANGGLTLPFTLESGAEMR